MYIIGTAGHVDHGKTALIKTLTGTDTDRLPEEKARGLTVDLGFAHLDLPDREPIGIIDVPGHEKYIRNMVAGAWGLSCALLLVAADDGWMAQTDDHALVLAAMKVPLVHLVISKADLGAPDVIREISDASARRFQAIFGYEPKIQPLSAHTGEGIEELKKLIADTLPAGHETTGKPVGGSGARLFVDRIFTVQGAGTVVTGSLCGGALTKGESVTLLPQGEAVKIRSIQTYNDAVLKVYPDSRAAFNLQGVKKADLHRGSCISAEKDAFLTGTDFYLGLDRSFTDKVKKKQGEQSLKRRMELEISFGTENRIAAFTLSEDGKSALVTFQTPASVYWGQPCVLIRHGGCRILGAGSFIWEGDPVKIFREHLAAALNRINNIEDLPHQQALRFIINGYCICKDADIRKAMNNFISQYKFPCESGGNLFVSRDFITAKEKEILALAGRQEGVSIPELKQNSEVEEEIHDFLIARFRSKGVLVLKGDVFFTISADSENLSPRAKELLALCGKNGKAGLEIKNIQGIKKAIQELVRQGLLVALTEDIFYTDKLYRSLTGSILSNRKVGDKFSIPEAKDLTGLSRKYIIPLLNRMEKDGYVRRDGDVRVVL